VNFVFVRYERVKQTTDVRVVEGLQDADLSSETLQLVRIVVPSGRVVGVRPAELLRVDDFNGAPFARRARHGLHHRRERAAAELVRNVVVRVDARELVRREVAVDVAVVLERL